MKTRILSLSAILLVSATALPTPALAVQGGIMTSVLSVFVNANPQPPPATGLTYGGCGASLANQLTEASNSPNCPGNWVSFGCDGTYTSKDMAQSMLDQAQLALSLKKRVYVMVDDTKQFNGYCTAIHVDVQAN